LYIRKYRWKNNYTYLKKGEERMVIWKVLFAAGAGQEEIELADVADLVERFFPPEKLYSCSW
jgi:hypothetical protein